MIEQITGFLSMMRKSEPVFLIGLAVAAGATLFLPENITKTLGIVQFRDEHREYIGALFMISSSLIAAQTAWALQNGARALYRRGRIRKERIKHLHNLTPGEKRYLIPFVRADQNTQYFPIDDGIAGGLSAKEVIYQASSVGHLLRGIAYNIQPWAKEYLKKHPDLLGKEANQ
jgi:hypothetical protein